MLQMLDPYYSMDADASNSLLPKLKSFHYRGSRNNFDLDFSVLARFLLSRRDNQKSASSNHLESSTTAQLQSVKFETTERGTSDARTLAQLEQFAAEGMYIKPPTADGRWL